MMAAKLKLLMVGGVVAVLGVTHAALWTAGNTHGKRVEREAQLTVIERLRNESRGLADELAKAQRARDRLTRERVQETYAVSDPSGCGDVDVPDSVYETLHRAATRSATD